MTNLHPLQTTDDLREGYARYLKTIYPFRDDALRNRFWQALAAPDQLVTGPLLEASPPYRPGRSIAELVDAGILTPGFRKLCATTERLPLDRPLYLHQEQAIANVVGGPDRPGRNLVVATGTGSGKTESFLIPILDHLLREEAAGTLAQPGVRALLLYPMNALANDQLLRLRELLAGYPAITYGRYTGETEENRANALDGFRNRHKDDPPPNEIISRAAMRDTPPHVLLTNYAMLEYLLLRPQDTELFDGPTGGHWRFIVADEAHVYDGATGIEVGMLLRRLRDRVLRGERGLRCIATSATLGGEDEFPAAADFAAELFDEPFAAEYVVAAARQPVDALGEVWGDGRPALYRALTEAVAEGDEPTAREAIAVAAERHGVPASVVVAARRAADIPTALYAVLRGDARLRRLQTQLADGPQQLIETANSLFAGLPDEAHELTVQLVDLAVRAQPDDDAPPLLPARYHVFARSLEGAFACLHAAAHPDNEPRLFLGRREECPDCGAVAFELATCARCGATYAVGELEPVEAGDERAARLRPLAGDTAVGSGRRAYFLLEENVTADNEDDQAEAELDGQPAPDDKAWPAWSLCLRCGMAVEGHRPPPCGCGEWRKVRQADFHDDNPEKMVCGKCRTRSQGIVYRLLTGRDAPVSVLATQLYSRLPPAPPDEKASAQPGRGRKLLIFADSRQDAAFMAPYLERTANNILYRRLILQMMTEYPNALTGELRIASLAGILQRRALDAGVLNEDADSCQRRIEALKWLTRELTDPAQTQGLEGLGMLRFRLTRPSDAPVPEPLLAAPWNLTEDEVWDVLEQLLDTVRRRGGVRFPDGVEPDDDFFAPRNRPYYLKEQRTEGKRLSRGYVVQGWSPRSNAANTRTDLLEKLLQRTAPAMDPAARRAEATGVLAGLWRYLHSGPWERIWHSESKPGEGTLHQIKADSWTWAAVTDADTVWRCGRCRHIAPRSLRGVCPVYGCEGQLEPVPAAELQGVNQHYRYLYRHLPPAYMRVEEHTAQWKSKEAAKIQDEFIDGKVNILSCSTTFELGVDVGALNAVMMRNVPPTTANYVQRAGRAGRRSHTAAFVLTYAQRRSHDLAYYNNPARMVGGRVRPPVIAIRNIDIVRRHMASVLIAAFLRRCADDLGRFGERSELKVGPFFLSDNDLPAGPELLKEYVATRPDDVRAALKRIVPEPLRGDLGIDGWEWLDELTNDSETGAMDVAAAMIRDDIALFHGLAEEARSTLDTKSLDRAKYYLNVEKTIRDRDLLNEFGRRGVLPKYGFPVDVVTMATDHIQLEAASRIELQRDLRMAISEFAPGSQIVAAKTVWTGGGLQKQPRHELVPISYGVCKRCGRFNRKTGEADTSTCLGCGQPLASERGQSGVFVRPEFGFVAQRMDKSPRPGETRPPRSYTSRVYFDDRHPPEAHDDDDHWSEYRPVEGLGSPSLHIAARYSHYGELIVINSGQNRRGFEICKTCGYGRPAEGAATGKPKGKGKSDVHQNPRTGRDCRGFLEHRHLGHDFMTDVLELRLSGPAAAPDSDETGKSAWWSALYALIEGASDALAIRRNDLNGTLYYYEWGQAPALVLYDDVPGGAGHMRRVVGELPAVFAAALQRVEQCSCGEETACHECLWNYYNQPLHPRLSRASAIGLLRAAMGVAAGG